MNKKWKIWIIFIGKIGIRNISRYKCDIFSNCIKHFSMVYRAEYISHLLIRKIIDTCTSNISYDSNLSDKVESDTIEDNSCLSRSGYRRARRCIERDPAKCATMTKSLYKS